MADESGQDRDPSPGRSDRLPRDDARDDAGRASNRRRAMIAGLLAAPTVMTLGARSARAQPPNGTTSCVASHTANPNTSAHCT